MALSGASRRKQFPCSKAISLQKSKDHKSSIYGVFKDKATGQTINDNVDIHVDNYGRPTAKDVSASHGCIRMPHHMSEKFFANVEIGTPVIVE